ncbi:unnamed protein product [Rodentolepis nana]|uniref:ULP_PROTEASE domain-containing protein n=1 Tax=Rodentolepis nana TaxID=102285 RepID=A0A0R3TV86_RODNA|nr:unnamed protein product [Rodentolepis nana]
MNDKDQVIKTKLVIRKTVIEKYADDHSDGERSQQKQKHRRRKEVKRRKKANEANKGETKTSTETVCDFNKVCEKCDMMSVENSYPDIANTGEKCLENEKSPLQSVIGKNQEESENSINEHQNPSQNSVEEGVHNEGQKPVIEPEIMPIKVESNTGELTTNQNVDISTDHLECEKRCKALSKNSHPGIANTEEKCLEDRSSLHSIKDQNPLVENDHEEPENPLSDHQNPSQCPVEEGMHNKDQTAVMEPEKISIIEEPNSEKLTANEILDNSTDHLGKNNEKDESIMKCDFDKSRMTFVENSHPGQANTDETCTEDEKSSLHTITDRNSVIGNSQEESETPISENGNSSQCSFEEDEGNDGQSNVEMLNVIVVPITEEDTKADSASPVNADSTKLQENLKVCSIPSREPEMISIMLKSDELELNSRNIADASSDHLEQPDTTEFDLFEILASKTVTYSLWTWDLLKDAFESIYSKAKENFSNYSSNKRSATPSESNLQDTANDKGTMKGYKMSQQLKGNPEPVSPKASNLCADQSESTPHPNSEVEACQKFCDSQVIERRILLKIEKSGNLEIIDVDNTEEALTPLPTAGKSEEKDESKMITDKQIDMDTPMERESNTALSDESEVQEPSEPSVEDSNEKIEGDKSTSYHVGSVTNCFKFLMENFCAELATGLEKEKLCHRKKTEEVSDQGVIEASSEVHEGSLINCYTFLVEEYHPDIAKILKEYCDAQELVLEQSAL